ncbi:MAG: penicillin-binding transpeptidase domain-containing protein [Bryobacteraceae bacterium]
MAIWIAWTLLLASPDDALTGAAARVMQGKEGVLLVAGASTGRLRVQHGEARRMVTPGSVIKPFVLLSAKEPLRAFRCPGRLRIGLRLLDCSHPATPPMDAPAALAYSCNNYFAALGDLIDGGALERTLLRFGLGSRPGSLRRPQASDARRLLAMGEDGLLATPLEMLEAWRRLALASDRTAVLDGLLGATVYGTARLARPEGMEVAGKTGTSATRDRRATHAWFAGWAPAERPEIVIVVFLEQGRGGGDAAPVARAIFEAYLAR